MKHILIDVSLIVLLIYTEHITNRFKYIAQTLLSITGISNVQFTDDANVYTSSSLPSINYSNTALKDNEIWIQPQGLLDKTNVVVQEIQVFDWKGLKVFFKTEGEIPFDIFSASFYLISRYEEYLPHALDEYGRYAHTNSIAFKENFLQLPLINLWLKEFVKVLKTKFPMLDIEQKPFHFLPTYDVDIAFAYADKSVVKNVLASAWTLINGERLKAKERINFTFRNKKDPFDVFDWLDNLHKKYQLAPLYFFLLAEKRKGYDKNVSPHSSSLQQLIEKTSAKYSVGIHPSWQSGESEKVLHKEVELLSNLIHKPVIDSRQHYIRMKMPDTYRNLLTENIQHDYSMGYGTINGFRASVSSPFYWYDLLKDEPTNLLIHPFCYMDANAYFEEHLSAQEASDELQYYHDTVKSVDGEFSIILHNHFLAQQKEWVEWRKMYEDFLQKNFY